MTTTGRELRDQGTQLSLLPLTDGTRETFDAVLATWAASGVPFTSDHLRDDLDAAQVPESARGGLMQGAYKRGLIVPTGAYVQSTHPATHAHPVRQWLGAQFHRPGVAEDHITRGAE